MVQGSVERLTPREISGEPNEQKESPYGLDNQGRKEDGFQDEQKVPSGGMHVHGLNDFPFFEGDSSAHESEEENRKGDDPQSPDLKENQCDDLTDEGQIFSYVQNHKACDTHTGSRHEQSIDKSQWILGG